VLIGLGVASGLLLGVHLTCLWGLRRSRGVRSELLVVALVLLPVAYFWGAEAFGWPTPGSIAESSGLLTGPVDRALVVGIVVATTTVTVGVLVKSGVTRGLERWSGTAQ